MSLTNPDEVFYAQTAKEMASRGEWLTPFIFDKPQLEKPIFIYWLLRVAFFIFGITSFAARFFPALFASVGVFGAYLFSLAAFKDRQKAFISSLILMSCGLYVGLARTVFTDMVFSIFILFALLAFFWGYSARPHKNTGIILFFFFSAFAVLTKGPLGFLIPFLIVAVFLSARKELPFFFCRSFLWGMSTFVLLCLPWCIFMVQKYGAAFMRESFYNGCLRHFLEAEHGGNDRWYFYPLSMTGCFFPWSVFMLAALYYLFKYKVKRSPIYLFLACWITATLVIFQFVHSKLVSYIFPLFPALALATGDFISDRILKEKVPGSYKGMFLLTWGILCAALIGIIIAAFKLRFFISSYVPVFVFIAIFIIWLSATLVFILKRGFLKTVYLLAGTFLLFIFAVPFVKKDIEPYISSREICLYLKRNYPYAGAIIAYKPYARGVRYYTGNEVAVFAPFSGNFFSPHPIPFLDTDEKTAAFLSRQPVTYCILRKRQVLDIEQIAKNCGYNCTLLKTIGDASLLKISQNKAGNN